MYSQPIKPQAGSTDKNKGRDPRPTLRSYYQTDNMVHLSALASKYAVPLDHWPSYLGDPNGHRVAVIIPCFKVRSHILGVLSQIPPTVKDIYVVDDACPEKTGQFVKRHVSDPRVRVFFNQKTLGVGGATKKGFLEACRQGATILVKLDGDGQMDPAYIESIIKPIRFGMADYTKGNRFFSPKGLRNMPWIRLVGNSTLSFLTKLSSGYWHVMDPTNGFIAIHAKVFSALDPKKIDNQFFFETDILCSLRALPALVRDIPVPGKYNHEKSNLNVGREILRFSWKHMKKILKRIWYEYFILDFNVGSAQLLFGSTFFLFGAVFGLHIMFESLKTGIPSRVGLVMLSVLTLIIGFQLLLSALNYDISKRNTEPIYPLL